ncbi:restriction endonuclease subunit S [Leuconostoc mesenteroides]|nr:restriction endonuclease subunit S [Leuconostoc mesenteroides]
MFKKIRNAFVGTATPYYVDRGHFYLESNNIKNGQINRDTEVFINDVFYNQQTDKLLHTGDIVMVQSGHVGHTAVIPSELNETAAHALIVFTNYKEATDPFFLNYQFQTYKAKRKLETITTGNTIKHILSSAMKEFFVDYPSFKEQKKIGSLFKQFDHLITQNGRKIDLLKQLKQAYLQKIFSQKLRFDGFHGTWEERDLSAISDKVTEKNKENQFSETFTNSAEYGIINQRDFFDKDISNEKNLSGYYIVHENDFVYNPRISNYAPVGPIKRNKLGRTGVMSPLYYVFRSRGVDKKYLEYYFDTTAWHIFLKMNGDSGARSDRFAIKDSVFNQMPIPYPTIGEQEQIGSFFEKLDKTIALRQQKLNLLKKQKHAYLQKMFI